MIRRILVALDGSSRAPHVLDEAANLARKFGSELVPVRAIFVPAEFPPSAHIVHGDSLPAFLRWEAAEELGELLSRAPDVPFAEPIIRHGRPWQIIVEAAEEANVDLVVVGSHGYHGVDRILGTTAARVVNTAHRNVLVVHDRELDPSPLGGGAGGAAE